MSTQNAESSYSKNKDETKKSFDGDLFERKELANQLTGFIKQMPNGVFAIDAPWGEGKSWFAENWALYLKEDNFITVRLDAFANDYIEDPFIMISSGLLAEISKQQNSNYKSILDSSKNIAKGLLPTVAKFGINIAGHLLLGNAELTDEIKTIKDNLQKDASDILEKHIEERLKTFESDQKTVLTFKESLNKLSKESGKPIVIFLDELDRCRPDFAVRTLERIKHFFDIEGVVFVLFINKLQLTESIKGCYGSGIDADTYLRKFIHFSLILPKFNKTEDLNHQTFCMKKLIEYGFSENDEDAKVFAYNINIISSEFNMSLRDIEQAVILLSITKNKLKKLIPLSAWSIALKICEPEIFNGIINNEMQFINASFNKINKMLEKYTDSTIFIYLSPLHDFVLNGTNVPKTKNQLLLNDYVYRVLRLNVSGQDKFKQVFDLIFKSVDLSIYK